MAADGQMSTAGGAQHVSAWNLPNILTSVRILMVPFFAWALWAGGPWGGDSLVARWVALALFAQQSLRGIFRRKRPLGARQHLRKGGTGRGQHARCQRDAMEPMSHVAPHRHIHDVIPRWLSTDTGSMRRARVSVVAPATVTAPSKLPPLISASKASASPSLTSASPSLEP